LNLSVKIGDLVFKNPVIAASGTFGFGREFVNYMDPGILGGISGKGITPEPRIGNEPPRIAETPCGIINSVGLQNPGLEYYIKNEIPFLRKFNVVNIANVAGNTTEDYCYMVSRLSDEDVDAIELNVSCPNVKTGCLAFGSNDKELRGLLKEVRKNCKKPLFVKLTPNVSDIALMARICEDEGADAVSLINTILALAIDIKTRMPVLKNNFGGLSGPCIKPIALRMVSQVYNSVSIPVIGMGGITNHIDVLEFMMAGAAACMVGTANFIDVRATETIIEGLKTYMKENMIDDISTITGSLKFH